MYLYKIHEVNFINKIIMRNASFAQDGVHCVALTSLEFAM